MVSLTTKSKLKLNPPSAGYYIEEDMQDYVSTLLAENKVEERIARTDLVFGNVVIVLEGEFAGKRVVYLGKKGDIHAICIGLRSLNGVPLFFIDEKFLLKTSTVLNLEKKAIPENMEIFESKKEYTTLFDTNTKISDFEVSLEENLVIEAKKVKFMLTYLKTDFNLKEEENICGLNF